jgi:hypothetical protein
MEGEIIMKRERKINSEGRVDVEANELRKSTKIESFSLFSSA